MADMLYVKKSTVTGLFDSIRDKTGGSELLSFEQAKTAVEGISGGGDNSLLIGLIERNITELVIPEGVTKIGDHTFSGFKNLTSITIPNSVTSIEQYAFHNCTGLTSITIPNSVTSIGAYAFYNSYSLKTVTMPSNLTSIGQYAFYMCNRLTTIDFSNSAIIPTITNTNSFDYLGTDCKIVVPDELYDEWIATDIWKDITDATIVKASEV